MEGAERGYSLIDFGEAGAGSPLIKTGQGQAFSSQSAAQQSHLVSPDRLKKFEEFIEEPIEGAPAPPKYWSIQFFQPYFDITTETVRRRLVKTLKPFHDQDFFESSLPDLYAPFWIATTLICVLTVSGNTANYMTMGSKGFSVDLSLLISCASLIYTLLISVPVAVFCLLKHAGSDVRFMSLLSLYGYSYLTFIPAVVICSLEIGWTQWLIMMVPVFWSFLLLKLNYGREVESCLPNKKYLLLCVISLGYLMLVLFINCSFLSVSTESVSSP